MTDRFDVVVVGAGPAGATAARVLAERGARTALVERARLPRYKTCAGGVPLRTAALLPFPIDPVVEDTVDRMAISLRGRHRYLRRAGRPYAFMTMRDRFDGLLAEHAASAGAELIDGTLVRRVGPSDGGWLVSTDRGDYRAAFVVGADGANSVVARDTRLGDGLAPSVAMEAEIRAPAAELRRWRRTVGINLGYTPWGYGWVFPKEERLSVGLVLPVELGGRIRPMLGEYTRRVGLSGADVERLSGHKVLFRRGAARIAGERAAVIGDAAGLADEFSEEGIYYAVRSGALAGAAIANRGDLRSYEADVDRLVQPELDAARGIARLFYASMSLWPGSVMFATHRIGYLWGALFRVQRGESTYDRELTRVGPLFALLQRAVPGALPA